MRNNLLCYTFFLLAGIAIFGCTKTIENDPPIIISVAINPTVIMPGSSALVEVVVIDNNGDNISYEYMPSAGTVIGNGPSVSWLSPVTGGIYYLAIKASDNNGGVSYDTINMLVSENAIPTRILGTAAFSTGVSGNLTEAKIGLFTSLSKWTDKEPLRSVTTTGGSFSIVNFTMDNLEPGTYFLDIWKDNDFSATWSNGDYVGWYGTGSESNPILRSFKLLKGQTIKVNLQMYVLSNKK